VLAANRQYAGNLEIEREFKQNLSGGRMNFVVPGLAIAFACTVAAAEPAIEKDERPLALRDVHRIVCLGDSITQAGEGPGGYVWLIREFLKKIYPGPTGGGEIEVLNAGISGHRSNDMLERFDRDVIDKKPDLVTISVGVNDVWHGFYDNHPLGDGPRGIPVDKYRANVEEMVARAQKEHAHVVILSTTVIHEELDGPENVKTVLYNAALRDIARKHGALFVDLQKPFRDLISTYRRETGARDLLLTVDGVHMNSLGNKVMAYTILNGLGVTPDARAAVQAAVDTGAHGGVHG
jgi:acyl-CoA thioesterase-1